MHLNFICLVLFFPERRSTANAIYHHYPAFPLPLPGSVVNVLPWNTNESLDVESAVLARSRKTVGNATLAVTSQNLVGVVCTNRAVRKGSAPT